MAPENGTQRILGQLLNQARTMEKRMDVLEDDIKQRRDHHDQELGKIRQTLTDMEKEWSALRGGRKMLAALLGAAAVLGGLLLELVKYLLTFR